MLWCQTGKNQSIVVGQRNEKKNMCKENEILYFYVDSQQSDLINLINENYYLSLMKQRIIVESII